MNNYLQQLINAEDYNPDGTMKPEYRQQLQRDGWSEEKIKTTEQRHIRNAAIDLEIAEWQKELERRRAQSKAQQEEKKRQRHQQISQSIQRSIALDKPFLVYAEGEEIYSDLELLYCIESNSIDIQQTIWLVEFLLLVLGNSPDNKEFYGSRLNQVIHGGAVSSDKIQAIEEKVKQLNITLPPLSTYNSGPPIDLKKASRSERRSFAMSGLDREELLSEGFLETDDFYDPHPDDEVREDSPGMQMPSSLEDVPDIEF